MEDLYRPCSLFCTGQTKNTVQDYHYVFDRIPFSWEHGSLCLVFSTEDQTSSLCVSSWSSPYGLMLLYCKVPQIAPESILCSSLSLLQGLLVQREQNTATKHMTPKTQQLKLKPAPGKHCFQEKSSKFNQVEPFKAPREKHWNQLYSRTGKHLTSLR